MSTNPDSEADLLEIFEELRAIEQEDSGLLQTLVMRNQRSPDEVYVVVVLESEEKARLREADPRRQDSLDAQFSGREGGAGSPGVDLNRRSPPRPELPAGGWGP